MDEKIKRKIEKLSGNLPDLSKEGVMLYTDWIISRRMIERKLDKNSLNKEELKNFYEICLKFSDFLVKNKTSLEQYKIGWDEVKRVIDKDVNFCIETAKRNNLLEFITSELKKEYKK